MQNRKTDNSANTEMIYSYKIDFTQTQSYFFLLCV